MKSIMVCRIFIWQISYQRKLVSCGLKCQSRALIFQYVSMSFQVKSQDLSKYFFTSKEDLLDNNIQCCYISHFNPAPPLSRKSICSPCSDGGIVYSHLRNLYCFLLLLTPLLLFPSFAWASGKLQNCFGQ